VDSTPIAGPLSKSRWLPNKCWGHIVSLSLLPKVANAYPNWLCSPVLFSPIWQQPCLPSPPAFGIGTLNLLPDACGGLYRGCLFPTFTLCQPDFAKKPRSPLTYSPEFWDIGDLNGLPNAFLPFMGLIHAIIALVITRKHFVWLFWILIIRVDLMCF